LFAASTRKFAVVSECPFVAPDVVTSVREYDASNGQLLRVLSPSNRVAFRRARALRFACDGDLYCVARDEVVSFDFASGAYLGAVIQFPRLNGQALAFF